MFLKELEIENIEIKLIIVLFFKPYDEAVSEASITFSTEFSEYGGLDYYWEIF